MNKLPALYAITLASGLCALVYEITWMRLFLPVFGLSVYATTTVLCAFMAGLGLGSCLAAPVIARWRRSPWLLYALLEFGIGLSCLLIPHAIEPITYAYVGVSKIDDSGYMTGSVRFVLSLAAMLVPSFFMGLTLPVLVHSFRSVAKEDRVSARRIGQLYGLNTVGAAAGCVVVGFVLLYHFGLLATVRLTASLNLSLAILVYILFARRDPGPVEPTVTGPPEQEPPEKSAERPDERVTWMPAGLILCLYGVIGFSSFGYELSWFRILIFYLQSATYSFSIMLTVYLLGVGLGSCFFSQIVESRVRLTPRRTAATLGMIQCGIGILGASALHVFNHLPDAWRVLVQHLGADSWAMITSQKFVIAGVLVFPSTFLMGVTFPLLSRLYKAHRNTDSKTVGHLYGVNTFGAIAGSLVTGFVLFDRIGVQATLLVLSVVSMAVGVVFALRPITRAWWPRLVFGSMGVAFIYIVMATPARMLIREFESSAGGKVVFYMESASDITFVTESLGDHHRELRFNDGRGTSCTRHICNYNNRLLAYSTMVMNPDAKDVLVISMGVGNTASAYTSFPIERLDVVDISPGAFEAAKYFAASNLNVLEDPRVHTHVEDGRNFLLKSRREYDIIQIELPSIHADGVVSLYTRDFYGIAYDKLKEGGLLSQWIDARQAGREVSYMLINTMRQVFPRSVVFASKWAWWVNGVRQEAAPSVDYERAYDMFSQPSVVDDLACVECSFEDTMTKIVSVGDFLADAVADAPTITDDRTVIDFLVPRLDSPYAIGGGVAHIGTPLRGLFLKRWKARKSVQVEKLEMFPFYGDERHQQLVDESLLAVTSGFPAETIERIIAMNGGL